jgi:PAS domain S-box-containing protein
VSTPPPYAHALDALPQLIWVAAPDGTLEYLNRRCADYSGLPIDDLLGWDWGWVVHPADLPATLGAWNRSLRDGTPHEVEFRLRRRDGEYRWFLARAEPARDADGAVVRWFGTCTDIDAARRAADRLRGVRLLFRGLVERSHDGEVLVGPDGTVRYANPAAARLLGFAADELTGTDLWGSLHPDDRTPLGAWFERVLASPGRRLATAARFALRDGTARRVEVLAVNLLPDPDVRAVAVRLRAADGDGADGCPSNPGAERAECGER